MEVIYAQNYVNVNTFKIRVKTITRANLLLFNRKGYVWRKESNFNQFSR